MIRRLSLALAFALALAGCALRPDGSIDWSGSFDRFSTGVNNANLAAAKYLPLVGKDLLAIGDIIVQAECSPIRDPATQAVTTALKLVAPTNTAAEQAAEALATNAAIAAQLCPFYKSIEATVGAVPTASPSGASIQSIPVPASSP